MSESTSSAGSLSLSDAELDSSGKSNVNSGRQLDADSCGQFDTDTLLLLFVISSSQSLSFSEVVYNLFRAS